jgi:homoserine kinase type II
MTVYTQLQARDVRDLCDDYGLAVLDFEPIEAGASNSNYVLHTRQGRYVLTFFDDKTLDHATRLARLLLLLEEYEFPAPRLLPPVEGGLIVTREGKAVMVKAYIAGEVHHDLDQAMLRQIGAAMARLHQVPVPEFLAHKQTYGRECLPDVVDQNVDPEYETWVASRFAELERRLPRELPSGLIHGDLFYDNVLFVDGELEAIIDLEEAIYHYKGFDLGMGIVGTCCRDSAVVLDKARALVDGYRRVRELEEGEKKALQSFCEYAATSVSCWRFWKYHVDMPSAEKADKHRHMVRIAENIRSIPRERFWDAVCA